MDSKFPLTATVERLAGKVESLEVLMGQVRSQDLPSLAEKLDTLRELLAGHRKDNFLVEEVAKLTGRAPYTVRRWIAEGKLRAIRLQDGGPRGRLLISRDELDRLIAAGKGGNVPATALG